MLRRTARRAVQVAAVVLVVSLVVGNVLGQPILLSYVTTDSMEPTLEPGDGFVAVPTAITGPPAEGDVVVYRSRALRPGELVSHRVVDRRPSGYVTKGDGNPFTDQSGSEPPVPRSRIEAVALTYGGEVVVIPELGTALMAVGDGVATLQRQVTYLTGSRQFLGSAGLGYLLLGGGAVMLLASAAFGTRRRRRTDRADRRSRPTVSVLAVVLVVSAFVAGPATAAMVASGGEETFTFVSSQDPSPNPTVVEAGTTTNGTYNLTNRGTVPMVVVFEPRHDDLTLDVRRATLLPGESVSATVTIRAPDESGYYRRSFVERRYFALLPPDWLVALDDVHPALALAAIDAVVVAGVALLVVGLFGRGPIVVRERRRSDRAGSGLGRLLR